jgi:MoaA/NifB/PqqE/SkfB family radical SAM enzyme
MGTTHLYRLPWTGRNSPNGWVEPTTHCQLKCPQCYRLIDRPGFRPAHRPIEEMEAEVDELIRRRNLQSLSISGGEPLLHPDLDRLIRYARHRGLQVVLLTNGILLDRSRVERLRDLDVARVMVHVESIQSRPGCETEEDATHARLI